MRLIAVRPRGGPEMAVQSKIRSMLLLLPLLLSCERNASAAVAGGAKGWLERERDLDNELSLPDSRGPCEGSKTRLRPRGVACIVVVDEVMKGCTDIDNFGVGGDGRVTECPEESERDTRGCVSLEI